MSLESTFTLTPRSPYISNASGRARFYAWGGYIANYGVYTLERQYANDSVVIWQGNLPDPTSVAGYYRNAAFLALLRFTDIGADDQFLAVFTVKSLSYSDNDIQIFVNTDLVREETLEHNVEHNIAILMDAVPSRTWIFIRPKNPDKQLAFYKMDGYII